MFNFCERRERKVLEKKVRSLIVNNNKKNPSLLRILRKLTRDQLTTLHRVLDDRGLTDECNGTAENCVLITNDQEIYLETAKEEVILTLCRSFKSDDASSLSELRILSGICGGGLGRPPESCYCCNPYHWSRVIRPLNRGMNVQKLLLETLASERRR